MYTDKNEIFDMECRIHRLEDKMFRCKNFSQQLEIREVLMKYRTQLQKMQWTRQRMERAF